MTAQPAAPAPSTTETPAGNDPEQQTAPTPQDPSQPQAGTWNPDAWDGKVESLPAEARRIIDDARSEAGKARTNAKQQAADEARAGLLKEIAPALKALGLEVPGGEELTVEGLQQQLATEATARKDGDAAHQNLQREHQVLLSAIKAGADHDALLDSRSFLAKVADLDPTANDFADKVTTAVTDAVKDNPKLKAGRAPGASSVDHPGGSGEGDVTAEQFKKMTGAERNELARRDPDTYNRLAGRA